MWGLDKHIGSGPLCPKCKRGQLIGWGSFQTNFPGPTKPNYPTCYCCGYVAKPQDCIVF